MARASGISVENSFVSGLITEASGLNFPENACTETYNCIFNSDGSVDRRLGFDFETNSETKIIDRDGSVVRDYVWRNVSGNGDLTLIVVQVGNTIYFYRTDAVSTSQGEVTDTVTLTAVTDAPSPNTVEAQFSDGNGLLFITHPYCQPMRVSYDASTDTATATDIDIKIRDFEGVDDGLDIDERPTSTLAALDDDHEYNLRNQGWNTTNLTAWDTAQTTMPSNVDVMWTFKNTSDNFSAANDDINRVVRGNSPAPKGHYILSLADQDRDTAAGTTDVPSGGTGTQRPSTSAFFAGRVFYSGVNYVGYNSRIFFTQIIERESQYEYCYQANDPTSEETFDLLPNDGGVISINEAGTIYKLTAVPGGLAVFAANGVWFITGSTGLGFTATDYTIQKISSITTLSASSFVDVQGFPSWWNAEGIYVMVSEGQSLPNVKSITDEKIKSFYEEIPLASKRTARGYYNSITHQISWLYKSMEVSEINEIYSFDRILNLNTLTGTFYPWTITDSDVKVHSIFVSDSTGGAITVDDVIDSSLDTVVDASGNQVVIFTIAGAATNPGFKFLVSYLDDTDYQFTFAETNNTDYLDWFQYDLVGEDFTSYFITGYKLRGEGLRKFQNNYIKIFSKVTEPVSYYFQGIWDYAITGSGTGRWSSRQFVEHTDTNYCNLTKRLKVRGHGIALQFKVESVTSMPFKIIGWSSMQSVNQIP